MNILAIQSSGNSTSLCVILKDDVLQYSINHDRKDRPNWLEMLSQIGLDSFFSIDDIDIFAYANDKGSYTATRSVASFLKGISSALNKPLVIVEVDEINNISGMDITFVTSTNDDNLAKSLLKELGLPFKKN